MGCDIHLEVERREEDGLWHLVEHPDRPCDNPYCEEGVFSREHPERRLRGKECYYCHGAGHYVRRAYSERNYAVFAMLADVRNSGFTPIAEPRGLPDDLSLELKERLAAVKAMTSKDWEDVDLDDPDCDWQYELGEHSFTHLSYSELLEPVYWQRTIPYSEWVDPWNFVLSRTGRQPSFDRISGSQGDRVEFVSNRFMDRLLDSGRLTWTEKEPDEYAWKARGYRIAPRKKTEGASRMTYARGTRRIRYLTWVSCNIPYSYYARDFLENIASFMQFIGDPPPAEVRLVMGFDS